MVLELFSARENNLCEMGILKVYANQYQDYIKNICSYLFKWYHNGSKLFPYRGPILCHHWNNRIFLYIYKYIYLSNISQTSAGNKVVDQSDVVGASPVGAASSTSSLSTTTGNWRQLIGKRQL